MIETNATNKTANYGLPLFIATDKPAWLIDWNNTMRELDDTIKSVSDAGDNTELAEIIGDASSGLVKAVSDLQSAIDSLNTSVSTNTSDIATIKGQITAIQSDLTTQNGLYQSLEQRVNALENS